MPKLKTLVSQYDDKSGFKIIRSYPERYFGQADRDLVLLLENGSQDQAYSLVDSELYDPSEPV